MSEIGWLIEHGGSDRPLYWTGESWGHWSGDHSRACRFARRTDAFKVSLILGDMPHDPPHRVAEHQWNTRAETPQSIPSERDAIVKWLRSHDGADQRAIQNGECVRGSTMHGELRDRAGYYLEVADAIERGEHLSTRQAPIEGSAK